MDDKYKLSGEDKEYKEDSNSFTKYHNVEVEFRIELAGYQLAKKARMPIPRIKRINEIERSIAFEKITWLRLDQLSSNYRNGQKQHLEFVRLCGHYIARLHQIFSGERKLDYSLQSERLIRLQNDLCGFHDINRQTTKKVIAQILDQLIGFEKLQSRATFIHGDFIHQNVFGIENNLNIIIFDWENSCYSDPVYDLSTFISFFLIIAVKSNFYTMEDVNRVERVLLDAYNQQMSLSKFDMQRYCFFKFLGHHCMYWYYLLILQKLSQKFRDGRIERLFGGSLSGVEIKQLVNDLNEENFRFKQTSFVNICLLLERSKQNILDLLEFPSIQVF